MKNIFLLMVAAFLFSCGQKEAKPPNLLPKDQMAGILADIHLLEAKVNALNLSGDTSIAVYKAYEYDLLVNERKIDTTVYQQSFEYYKNHLKEFHQIYEMVGDSLNKKQTQGL